MDGDTLSCALGGWEENSVASVVFKCRTDIVAKGAMRSKSEALEWRVVGDDFGARDREGFPVEVIISEEAGVSRETGLSAGGTKMVEGEVALWQ